MTEIPLTDHEKKKIRRLAEAIREGAKIRPQITEVLWGKTEQGAFGSCALGAAWEATHPDFDVDKWNSVIFYGKMGDGTGLSDVNEFFGHLDKIFVRDPVDGSIIEIDSIITDLNDRQGWTREQIADWLLSLV